MPYKQPFSVEKTRAAIETYLMARGATKLSWSTHESVVVLSFRMRERTVIHLMALPRKDEKRFKVTARGWPISERSSARNFEEACKTLWQAFHLCLQGKLNAVGIGIATFEEEFAMNLMLPNGRTIGEVLLPKLELVLSGKSKLSIAEKTEDR